MHDHHDKIKKVCCDIFEQLAFMFAEEVDIHDIDAGNMQLIHASMAFSGNSTGTIDITMPTPLAAQLAQNILGLEDTINIDQQHYEDSVKELLNTICGRMLTMLFGEEAVFDLHVPSTRFIDPQQLSELTDAEHCIAFMVEEMPVIVRVFL